MMVGLLDRGITDAVAISGAADVMASFLDLSVHLALWRRDRPALLDWIDALDLGATDDIGTRIVGPDFGPDIWQLLCNAGYRHTAQGRDLCHDVANLATRFTGSHDC